MSRRSRNQVTDIPEHLLPIVAIVGRPNVGKSTLFNRLTGTRQAAVIDEPGITRDRNYGTAHWGGRDFRLIDTGGFEGPGSGLTLAKEIREQAMVAIEQADVIVALAEVGDSDNPTDHDLIDLLRRSGKPFVVGVNKCEKQESIALAWELTQLGIDELFPMSALHGNGNAEMLDRMLDLLPPEPDPALYAVPEEPEDEDDEARWERRAAEAMARPLRLAIVGRQNVGKSTLVNQLLGHERVIASDLPGTTRDAIDSPLRALERDWVLVDTAGIRRRGKVGEGIEGLTSMSSLFAMERADVAVLLIDAVAGLTAQDKHIAGYAVDRGCALIVGVNKWDALDKDHRTADEFVKKMREDMPFAAFAPVVTLSALTGQRAERVLKESVAVFAEACRHFRTGDLIEWANAAMQRMPPPMRRNRRFSMKYVAQAGILPPTFTLFCNDPKLAHFSYRRYLTNDLRETFGLKNVPVRLKLRQKRAEHREYPDVWQAKQRAKK